MNKENNRRRRFESAISIADKSKKSNGLECARFCLIKLFAIVVTNIVQSTTNTKKAHLHLADAQQTTFTLFRVEGPN